MALVLRLFLLLLYQVWLLAAIYLALIIASFIFTAEGDVWAFGGAWLAVNALICAMSVITVTYRGKLDELRPYYAIPRDESTGALTRYRAYLMPFAYTLVSTAVLSLIMIGYRIYRY